jgi:hypothetical protein
VRLVSRIVFAAAGLCVLSGCGDTPTQSESECDHDFAIDPISFEGTIFFPVSCGLIALRGSSTEISRITIEPSVEDCTPTEVYYVPSVSQYVTNVLTSPGQCHLYRIDDRQRLERWEGLGCGRYIPLSEGADFAFVTCDSSQALCRVSTESGGVDTMYCCGSLWEIWSIKAVRVGGDTWIYFVLHSENDKELWRVEESGEDLSLIAQGLQAAYSYDVSAETSLLAYVTDGGQLVVSGLDGENPSFYWTEVGGPVVFSPDGQELALNRTLHIGESSLTGLFITSSDGEESRHLFEEIPETNMLWADDISWSPDGSALAVYSPSVYWGCGWRDELWVVDSDLSAVHRVWSVESSFLYPVSWVPD